MEDLRVGLATQTVGQIEPLKKLIAVESIHSHMTEDMM